jgi:HEAT repeat protein
MSVRRLLALVIFLLGFGCQSAITRQELPAAPKVPPEVAEQIERLSNKDADVRAFAPRLLGEMGEKAADAVPHLVRLLSDNSQAFLPPHGWTCPSSEAKDALVKIGKPSVEPLMEVVNGNNLYVRNLAVEALIKIGDPRAMKALSAALARKDWDASRYGGELAKIGKPAVEMLLPFLESKDEELAIGAASALGKIGDKSAAEGVLALFQRIGWRSDMVVLFYGVDPRSELAEAAARLGGRRAAEILIPSLKDPSEFVRERTAKALGETNCPEGVPPLAEALNDESESVRMNAAGSLGKIRDPRAVEPLATLLDKERKQKVREAATEALGRMGGPAVDSLIALINDTSRLGREKAVQALGMTKDRRAVEPLIEYLGDDSYRVRYAAAKALGEMQAVQSADVLIEAMLYDEHPQVRGYAQWALARLGSPVVDKFLNLLKTPDKELRHRAAEILKQIADPGTVKPLLTALASEDEEYRQCAAEALCGMADAIPAETLIDWLKDKKKPECLRELAAAMLYKVRDEQATDALLAALRDENRYVQLYAIGSLCIQKSPRGVKPLAELLASGYYPWGMGGTDDVIFNVLWMLGKPAVEPLISVLPTAAPGAKAEVICVLSKIGDTRAVEAIIPFLKEGLGEKQITSPAPGQERAIYEAVETRRCAAMALGQLGDTRAVGPLIEALADKTCAACAAKALGEIGDPRAVEPLIVVVKRHYERFCKEEEDEDGGVWVVPSGALLHDAIDALGKLGDSRAVEPLMSVLREECNRRLKKEIEQYESEEVREKAIEEDEKSEDECTFSYENWGKEWSDESGVIQPQEPFFTEVNKVVQKALVKVGRDSVSALIAALKDKNEYIRAVAAEMLGEIREPQAAAPLAQALGDRRRIVRLEATRALYRLGKPALEHLISALKSENWQTRIAAATALGGIKDDLAVKALANSLRDSHLLVKACAARSLLALDREKEKVTGYLQLRFAVEGHQTCKVALEPLAVVLKDKDPQVRLNAVGALTVLADKPQGREALASALQDEDNNVRCAVALALGGSKDSWAIETLLEVISGDFSSDARYHANSLLEELYELADLDTLLAALKNQKSSIRKYAAKALGKLREKRAVEPLIEVLKDPDSELRACAAEALGNIGDSRATDALLASLKDTDKLTRGNAAHSLGLIGESRSVEPLLACLSDSEPGVRSEAARALGTMKEKRASEPLVALLGDSYWGAREAAIWALGELKDARAVRPLRPFLEDKSYSTRRAAIDALVKIASKEAIEALIAALFKEDSYKTTLDEILAKMGDKAIEPLITAVKENENRLVRANSLHALVEIADPCAFEFAIGALKDKHEYVRAHAAKALGEIGLRSAIKPLIEALDDEDENVKSEVLQALHRLTDAPIGQDRTKWQEWFEKRMRKK